MHRRRRPRPGSTCTSGSGARLVTLVGPGGIGKTTLAKRYVARRSQSARDDVFFADLTEARSLDKVVGAVASAVGVTLGEAASAEAAVEQLWQALASQPDAVLILDNVEGREVAVSAALDAWLRAGGGARFLLTSRVKLGRRDERCVDVGPLSPEHAVRLFEARALRLVADFAADASTRELMVRLDGNPLAIELAAARLQPPRPPLRAVRERARIRVGAPWALGRSRRGSPGCSCGVLPGAGRGRRSARGERRPARH